MRSLASPAAAAALIVSVCCSYRALIAEDVRFQFTDLTADAAVRDTAGRRPALTDTDLLLAMLEDGEEVIKPDSFLGEGEMLPTNVLPPLPPEPALGVLDETAAEPPGNLPPLNLQWRATYIGGNGVGQDASYGSVGLFRPFEYWRGVGFLDAQLNVDHDSSVGGNMGVGQRWYHPRTDGIFGVNLYLDIDTTSANNTFLGLGPGFECRHDQWDVWGNAYIPVGDCERVGEPIYFGLPRFGGDNIVMDQQQVRQVALTGLDLNLARRIGGHNLWAEAGWYHFQGGGRQLHGARGTIRGWLTSNLHASVTLSNDPLFGTNLAGGLTLFFGPAGGSMPQDNRDRIVLPTARSHQMGIADLPGDVSPVALTQSGEPITVAHVNDAATFNAAKGGGNDIVLLHADSDIDMGGGTPFPVAANQRVLGESDGQNHLVPTDQLGVIDLPRATAGTNRPIVRNAGTAVFTLADKAEVSNVGIENSPSAIFGDGLAAGVNLNRLAIANIAGTAVDVMNVAGEATLTDIDIDVANTGISLNSVNTAIVHRAIINNIQDGVVATNVDVLAIRDSEMTGTGRGVTIEATGTNMVSATVENNIIFGFGSASRFRFGPNTGAALNLNIFSNEDSAGFDLQRDANGVIRLGGSLGTGMSFNDDNGNLQNNGNTSFGGLPTVIISGAGNQIQIIDPLVVPVP